LNGPGQYWDNENYFKVFFVKKDRPGFVAASRTSLPFILTSSPGACAAAGRLRDSAAYLTWEQA
jgi:hypothetical protein